MGHDDPGHCFRVRRATIIRDVPKRAIGAVGFRVYMV
jgi:hypothetical protein